MTMDGSKIGARVKELRTKAGLSMGQLADMTGVSKTYVWQLEKGDIPSPGANKLADIAAALGVTVSHLLDQQDEQDALDAAFFARYQRLTRKRLARRILEALIEESK